MEKHNFMNRTEREEYIIGSISLLSNRLSQFSDDIFPDITFKQFILLITISKMEVEEKSINSIAEVVGTTRQNIKRILTSLEAKEYVVISKSDYDARALKVELTQKTYQYFSDNEDSAKRKANQLFATFSDIEIDNLVSNFQKLFNRLELYNDRGNDNE